MMIQSERPDIPAVPSSPADASSAEPAIQHERRRYAPPRLRFLGSVRDLTLGSGGGISDGRGTFHP
jgi:hypothetical protein